MPKARRTKLEILADTHKSFTYYFTDNFSRPIIVIGKCEVQFKNRKDAFNYAEAVHTIKRQKSLNMNTQFNVKRARKAMEGRV